MQRQSQGSPLLRTLQHSSIILARYAPNSWCCLLTPCVISSADILLLTITRFHHAQGGSNTQLWLRTPIEVDGVFGCKEVD